MPNMYFYHLIGASLLVMQNFASGDYLCEESMSPIDEACSDRLTCEYSQYFREKDNVRRFCRCRTEFKYLPNVYFDINILNQTCFKYYDKLQQLYLKNSGITRIDNTIFEQYSNLEVLNLAGNNIQLNFSTEIKHLNELDISFNNLKSLPSVSLIGLKSVKLFNASFNKINDINLSFNQLVLIEELYLNNNQLKEIGVNDFDELSRLRVLNLAFNFLKVIKSDMVLVQLRELYLNNNQLSRLNIEEDVTLPSLQILNIEFNNFTILRNKHNFNFMDNFHGSKKMYQVNETDLPNLLNDNSKQLKSSVNKLERIEENMFKLLNNLTKLDISFNKLEKIENLYLDQLTRLQYLNLTHNFLNEKSLNCENFKNMEHLQVLDLSFNLISKLYNCSFEKLNQLRELNLKSNQINTLPQGVFDNLNNLENLDLAENRIVVLPEGVFIKNSKLRNLNISHNNIAKFQLNQVSQLSSFDFGYNPIQCKEVSRISNLLKTDGTKVLPCNDISQCCTENINGSDHNKGNSILPYEWMWILVAGVMFAVIQALTYFIFMCSKKKGSQDSKSRVI